MGNSAAVRYVGLLGAIFVIGIVAFFGEGRPPAPITAREPLPAVQPSKPKKDWSDLAQDENYVHENKRGFRDLLALFRRRGLTCPAVTHMWNQGITPFGQKLEILCGPPGSGDAYPELHYAVYPENGRVSICQPFGASIAKCQ